MLSHMAQIQIQPARHRLGSISDSAPPSESSDGTNQSLEHNDIIIINTDWSRLTYTPPRAQRNDNSGGGMHQGSIYNESSEIDADNDADDTLSIETTSNATSVNLSEYERGQIESFFGGLDTEILVSSALANLYEGTGNDGDWRLTFTGIPVILYDKGNARARAAPQITLVLAERGTCFALWSDRVDGQTNYRTAGPSFHTMNLSKNRDQLIGFSFDSTDAAHEFWQRIEYLLSRPENIELLAPNGPTTRKQKKHKHKQQQQQKQKQKQKRTPLPPKSQISQPCQFQHVTSVTKNDANRYYSMQLFAPFNKQQNR